MSTLTFEQAEDEIIAMFVEGWAATGDPTPLDVYYEDVPKERLTDNAAFASVQVNFRNGSQRGFGGGEGGLRMFQRHGDFRCQIHTLAGKGLLESRRLAKVVVDSFEGKHSPGGVWFRSINIVDIGRNGLFRIDDIAVFFEYDEVK